MSGIYAPPGPSVTGTQITVERFINNPVLVYRTLRGLVNKRMVGGLILSGRLDLTGSGAAIFEVSENPYATTPAEMVDDLMEYPNAADTPSDVAVAETEKWGLGVDLSDKIIARNRWDIVRRKLIKLANRIALGFDDLVLSAVASAVTQTQPAAAAWNLAAADPFLDAMLSNAVIDGLDEGYEGNVILARPVYFARLVAAAKVLENLPRETSSGIVLTGNMLRIAGLTIVKTNRLPVGVNVMVLDSMQLGSIAYERQGGGYQGDPSGQAPGDPGIESKVFRKEDVDGVRIQCRKVGVPMVQEPGAAVKMTGV